jgi:hypothetical protein
MKRWILAGVFAAAAITTASAQDKPVSPEKPAQTVQQAQSTRQTSLKVLFLLTRYQGEKRISSMPYTLGLVPGNRTSMRMGIAVPVASTLIKDTTSIPSYSYRDVGTNIDCNAQDFGNGVYQLGVTIADSSVHGDAGEKDAKFVRDVPVFRTFNATFTMVLRDGQTMQYASVTDPLSGEVMKVDVTLNTVK